MRHPAPLAAALVLLAACVAPPAPPEGDACGAAGLQGLVGQPETVLAAMTFPAPMRVLRPGMAVTMDYSPDRLNVTLDAGGTITRVACG
jgi:hypothetical protein